MKHLVTSSASPSYISFDNSLNILLNTNLDLRTAPADVLRDDSELGQPLGWKLLASEYEISGSPGSLHSLAVSLNGNRHVDGINLDAVRLEQVVTRQFTYDNNGNLLEEIDTLDRITNYTYDELGRVDTVTLPDPSVAGNPALPRPKTTTNYDGYGNVISTLEDRGGLSDQRTTTWTYDQRNRLLTEVLDDGGTEQVTTKFEYDDVGNLERTTEDEGGINAVTVFDYDRLNRLTHETVTVNGVDLVTESIYDALGQLERSIDTIGALPQQHTTETIFGYDNVGRQTHVTRNAGGQGTAAGGRSATTRFEYDAVGNLRSTIDPLGNVSENQFDRLDRLVASIAPAPAKNQPPATNQFTYDVAGNLTTQTNGAGETETFVYDNLGRLIRSHDALDVNLEHGTKRRYDSEGNQVAYTDPNDNTTTYTYDALNRLTSETIMLGPNGDVPASRVYLYNAQGNLDQLTDRNGRDRTFEYDRFDRQTTENWLDGASTEIAELAWQYDKLGRVTQTRDKQGLDLYIESFTYDDLSRVTAAYNYDQTGAVTPTNPRVAQSYQHVSPNPNLYAVTEPELLRTGARAVGSGLFKNPPRAGDF